MDWFSQNETLIQQICVFAIAAASLQVVMRAGVFSLLSAGVWLVGAYAAAIAVREGAAGVVALFIAAIIGMVVAVVMGVLMRRLHGLQLAMGSLAFVLVVAVALRAGGDFTGGALGLFSIPVLVSTTGAIVVAIVAAVGLTFLERGRMGRAIETMREDTHVASAVGIPVERFRLGLLTVSGVLAALSGGMYALMFNAVSPDIGGFPLIVSLLSMVVIGGLASWRGAYLGAAILTWLPDAVTSFDAWSEAAYGAILIAVVILAPGGLLGIAEQVIAPIRGRLARKPELVG